MYIGIHTNVTCFVRMRDMTCSRVLHVLGASVACLVHTCGIADQTCVTQLTDMYATIRAFLAITNTLQHTATHCNTTHYNTH